MGEAGEGGHLKDIRGVYGCGLGMGSERCCHMSQYFMTIINPKWHFSFPGSKPVPFQPFPSCPPGWGSSLPSHYPISEGKTLFEAFLHKGSSHVHPTVSSLYLSSLSVPFHPPIVVLFQVIDQHFPHPTTHTSSTNKNPSKHLAQWHKSSHPSYVHSFLPAPH